MPFVISEYLSDVLSEDSPESKEIQFTMTIKKKLKDLNVWHSCSVTEDLKDLFTQKMNILFMIFLTPVLMESLVTFCQ